MTRSVEIPDEAYENATDAIAAMLRSWPASASLPHHPDLSPRDALRAFAICALEAAALPYLAPAEVCSCRTVAPSGWDRVVDVTDPGCVLHGQPAPAGDGGLREALEQLAADYEYIPSFRIEELLAAHPAAPAVPQPVDRPLRTLAEWLVKLDDPGSEDRRTVNLTKIITMAAAAIAASEEGPVQPVDREALVEAISARLHITTDTICDGGQPRHLSADTAAVYEAADAVLAVLAGEQEQVEP